MSDTLVDLPKIAQMLDAGWSVRIQKNTMCSYEAHATHKLERIRDRIKYLLRKNHENVPGQTRKYEPDYDWDGAWLMTDDFTPEQALTRLAYKAVDGQVI